MADTLELEFDGKTIFIQYFDTADTLMNEVRHDGNTPHYEAVAYCDTYPAERTDAWGKIYILRDGDIDSISHECVHLASGIMARMGRKPMPFTTWDASPLEEEFCGLVGSLVAMVTGADRQDTRKEVTDLLNRLEGEK